MIDHNFPKSSKFRKKNICANLLFFTSLITCSAVSNGGAMRLSTSSLKGAFFFDTRPEQTRHDEVKGKIDAIKGLFVNRRIANRLVSSKNKYVRRKRIKLNSDATNIQMKQLSTENEEMATKLKSTGIAEVATRLTSTGSTGEGTLLPYAANRDEIIISPLIVSRKLATILPSTGSRKIPIEVKNLSTLTRKRRERDIISSMENDFKHDKNKHENFPVLSKVKGKVNSILFGVDNSLGKLFSGSNFHDFHQNAERRESNLTPEIHPDNYDTREVHLTKGNNSKTGHEIFNVKSGPIGGRKVKKADLKMRHRIRHTAKKGGHREAVLRDSDNREIKSGFLGSDFQKKVSKGVEMNEYAAPLESLHKSKQLQMMKGDARIDGGNRRESNETSGVGFPIKPESSLITLKRQSSERNFFNAKEYLKINDLEGDSDSSISSSDGNSLEEYLNYRHRNNKFGNTFGQNPRYLDNSRAESYNPELSEVQNSEHLLPTAILEQNFLNSKPYVVSKINPQPPITFSASTNQSNFIFENFTKNDHFDNVTSTNDEVDFRIEYREDINAVVGESLLGTPAREVPLINGQQIVKYSEDDFDLHNSFHTGKNLLTTTSEAALLLAIPLALLLTLIILTFAACCCYRHRQLHFVQHEEKGQLKLLGYYDEFGHNPEENVVGCCGCRALESCCLPDLSYQLHRAEWVKKNSILENDKSFVVFEDDLELAADVGPDLIGHPPLYDLLSNLPPRRRKLSHNGRKYPTRNTNLRKTKSVELLCV